MEIVFGLRCAMATGKIVRHDSTEDYRGHKNRVSIKGIPALGVLHHDTIIIFKFTEVNIS